MLPNSFALEVVWHVANSMWFGWENDVLPIALQLQNVENRLVDIVFHNMFSFLLKKKREEN